MLFFTGIQCTRTRDGVNFPMDAVAFLAIPRACDTSCFSSSFVWAGGRGTVERGPLSNSYVARETQLQLKPTFYSATIEVLSDVFESLVFVFCYAFLPLGIPFLKLVLKWILKIQSPFKKVGRPNKRQLYQHYLVLLTPNHLLGPLSSCTPILASTPERVKVRVKIYPVRNHVAYPCLLIKHHP